MKHIMRRYRTEEDYWRIREFLRRVFILNGRHEYSWQVAQLDYWRWHVIENCKYSAPVEEATFLWETIEGAIVAVLTSEIRGEVQLHVDPQLRSAELEEEMLIVAEQNLSVLKPDSTRKLETSVWCNDGLRQDVLIRRGYSKTNGGCQNYTRQLSDTIPDEPVPDGYIVRSLDGEDELPARSWASWRAFHPAEPKEQYKGWEWYRNIQRMPLYRRDLDIVAVSEDGAIAAFATLWYDDVTRAGYFEPVGRVPEHQVHGLTRAVLFEAMRRLKKMGGVVATVGGCSFGANVLYSSVTSMEYDICEQWVKEISHSTSECRIEP